MFCTKCGWKNNSDSSFCVKCGNPIANQESETGAFVGNTLQGAPQSPMQQHITQHHDIAEPHPNVLAGESNLTYSQETHPMYESTAVVPQQREKTPDKKRASHGGKYLGVGIGATAIVLVAVFILLNVLGVIQFASKHETLQETFEGPGYSTPEEAARAYVEAIKSMDVRRVWSTFAIESYVKNYDFVSSIERVRAYTPAMQQLAPSSNDFSYSVNILRRLNDAAPPYSAQWAYEITDGGTVVFPSGYTEGNKTVPDGLNYSQFSRYLEDSASEKLTQIQSIEITDIVLPDNFSRYARKYGLEYLLDTYFNETNTNNLETNRRILGADEIVDVLIFLKIDNEEYVMAPNLVRYGDSWRVLSRTGNVGMLLGFSFSQFMVSVDG